MNSDTPRLVSFERHADYQFQHDNTSLRREAPARSNDIDYPVDFYDYQYRQTPGSSHQVPAGRSQSFHRNHLNYPRMGSAPLRRSSNSVAPIAQPQHSPQRERDFHTHYGNTPARYMPSSSSSRPIYHNGPSSVEPRKSSYDYFESTRGEFSPPRHLNHYEEDVPAAPIYEEVPTRTHSNYQMQHHPDTSFTNRINETDILDDGSDEQSDIYTANGRAGDDNATSSEDEDFDPDDPEFLEIQERENIICKYEKGPEGTHVDDWENPESDLFKKVDRFGFLHKDDRDLSDEQRSHKRRIEHEFNREKKWTTMIKELEKSVEGKGRRPKKLDERIWKGIPAKFRLRVWPLLLEVPELKGRRPGTYKDLLLRARLVSKDIKQIDLDINRTYRDHDAFRKRYDVKQQSLLNVLAAYSMYNTEVGYCQGMSQIAALFLMYLDEEDAFWCLHSIMVNPKHTMHGFFVPGFPKLTRFEEHFKKVLKKYKPRIYKHLEKQDIPYIYLTKWWFGCFLDRVPFSLALRLWDVYLIEGDAILIAMALNIMRMHEQTIRKLQIDSFMEFIQMKIASDFGFSDDQTMLSLKEMLAKLRNDRLHIPQPPSDKDLAERPTKALGPILAKPLGTIRDELSEIQSRHSLAVSNGRSPRPGRKNTKNRSGSRTPHMSRTNLHTRSSSSFRENPAAALPPTGQEVPFEIPSMRGERNNMTSTGSDGFDSNSSYKHSISPQNHSPSKLSSPSFIAGSTSQQHVLNGKYVYSSDRIIVSRTSSIRDERTGKDVTIVRDDQDSYHHTSPVVPHPLHKRYISDTSTRVTQGENNVTYINLDCDDDSSSVI